MTTQYTSRAAVSALTAAQSSVIGDATVISGSSSERWLYSDAANDDAFTGIVIIPAGNPSTGRWLRQADYATLLSLILASSSGSGSGSSSDDTSDTSVTLENILSIVSDLVDDFDTSLTALQDVVSSATLEQNAASYAYYQRTTSVIKQVSANASAAISKAQTLAISASESIADITTTVTTQYDTAISLITQEAQARSTNEEETATTINSLSSTVSENAALLTQEAQTRASDVEILSTELSSLSSSLQSDNATLTAYITQEVQTRASAIETLAAELNTFSSVFGNSSSSAAFQINTAAISTGSLASASATLTATDGTNTAVAGFKTIAVSENGSVYALFEFEGDYIVFTRDGATPLIYFDMIKKSMIFNSGTYMKVIGIGFGANSNLLEWAGPTQSALSDCTQTNATSYITISGDAGYTGAFSVGDLDTGKSTSSTAADASVETAVFGSDGNKITVSLSYIYQSSGTSTYSSKSDWQSAVSSLGLTANSDGTYSKSGSETSATYVDLYRAVAGGSYASTPVDTITVYGSYGITATPPSSDTSGSIVYKESMSGSVTYTDPDLSTENRQYKAAIRTRNVTYTYNVTQRLSVDCAEVKSS